MREEKFRGKFNPKFQNKGSNKPKTFRHECKFFYTEETINSTENMGSLIQEEERRTKQGGAKAAFREPQTQTQTKHLPRDIINDQLKKSTFKSYCHQ